MTLETQLLEQENRICIVAQLDGEWAGQYDLSIYRKVDGTYMISGKMFSAQKNRGIPRALLASAIDFIINYTLQHKKRIVHKEQFITQEATNKLSHLFREFGYILTENTCMRVYQ